MYAYYIYYILSIVMIPGIILGIWAQIKVYSSFNKFSKISTTSGKTASQVARHMLNSAGYSDINIKSTPGSLTDNFNPKTDTISLSETVYNKKTVAAVGVAAHEVGHVFQFKQNYAPIYARNALVPIINILGYFVWPLLLIGIVLELFYNIFFADVLIYLSIGIYSLNTVFCLITLPIELNASKRAYNMLIASNEMNEEEAKGAKKVLNAAALTYVAALITSVLSLLRLLLYVASIKNRN